MSDSSSSESIDDLRFLVPENVLDRRAFLKRALRQNNVQWNQVESLKEFLQWSRDHPDTTDTLAHLTERAQQDRLARPATFSGGRLAPQQTVRVNSAPPQGEKGPTAKLSRSPSFISRFRDSLSSRASPTGPSLRSRALKALRNPRPSSRSSKESRHSKTTKVTTYDQRSSQSIQGEQFAPKESSEPLSSPHSNRANPPPAPMAPAAPRLTLQPPTATTGFKVPLQDLPFTPLRIGPHPGEFPEDYFSWPVSPTPSTPDLPSPLTVIHVSMASAPPRSQSPSPPLDLSRFFTTARRPTFPTPYPLLVPAVVPPTNYPAHPRPAVRPKLQRPNSDEKHECLAVRRMRRNKGMALERDRVARAVQMAELTTQDLDLATPKAVEEECRRPVVKRRWESNEKMQRRRAASF